MLDFDLAELYHVETKVFNQVIKRNIESFPEDFMFRLTKEEWRLLRSQIVTLEKGKGRYPKYAPLAFTEHGVAMLSAVLRSPRAVQTSIAIVRAFVHLREMIAANKDLAQRVEKLETGQRQVASIIDVLVDEIEHMKRLPPPSKRKIGFDL